ncbi:Uncharacterised protein [uncultured archaeon]|nr:Uncharacterised protein [uncultured archaeon]
MSRLFLIAAASALSCGLVFAGLRAPLLFQMSPIDSLLLSIVLSVFIEALVVFYYYRGKPPVKILATVLVANLASAPLIWFLFTDYGRVFSDAVVGAQDMMALLLSLSFATLLEGTVLYFANRELIDIRTALKLGLLMNAASAFAGELLLLLLMGMY